MSSLIKAASEPVFTSLSFGAGRSEAPSNIVSHEAELGARNKALEIELQETKRGIPKLLDQAREDGAKIALEARSDAEARNLKRLEECLGEALSSWSERLARLDGLAASLCRSILEQVFVEGADRVDALDSAIKRRLALLDGQKVISLRVSDADFPSVEALDAFAGGLDGSLIIQTDASLEAGECVLDLNLGHIDVGLAAQWFRVAEFLDRIEQEGLGA